GQTITMEASSPGGVGGATVSLTGNEGNEPQTPGKLYLSKDSSATVTNQQLVFVFTTPQPTRTYIASGLPLTQGSVNTTKGLVMWYHALKADTPEAVSPDQLVEWSFRGAYLQTLPTAQPQYNILPPSGGYFIDSAGYDVSYVDAMMLPVAMEVTNAIV